MRPAPQDGCTPLIAAARFGKAKVVRLLVERGADTEASNRVSEAVWGRWRQRRRHSSGPLPGATGPSVSSQRLVGATSSCPLVQVLPRASRTATACRKGCHRAICLRAEFTA